MGHGRPCSYTAAIGDAICEHIAQGGSLIAWCAEPGRPGYSTVTDWLRRGVKEDPEDGEEEPFPAKYARAREDQGDHDADHIRGLAAKMEGAKNRTEVEALKAAASEYRWLAGKRKPRVYGDSQRVEHSGDESKPVVVKLVRVEGPGG